MNSINSKPSTGFSKKLRLLKIGINIGLLSILLIVLAQNVQQVDMEILFWEAHIPLVVLLLGTALLSALIVFIGVFIIGRRG